ncbi:MAG: hypothetical protein FDW93_00025 [Bergeyella sp.]|nr:hypothetical protein [Bergeyella sp.]
MKKFWVFFVVVVSLVSCSKEVEIGGNVTNASSMDRIELIETSGISTLPLVNVGINEKGNFSARVQLPKNGMYVLAIGGKVIPLYIERGQKVDISGDMATIAEKYIISGDAEKNNDFLRSFDAEFKKYTETLSVEDLIKKNEKKFISLFEKIHREILQLVEKEAQKYKADDDVSNFKKLEIDAKLVSLLDSYEQNHGAFAGDRTYKVSKKFRDLYKNITKDNDRMVREIPIYRSYKVNKLGTDFQTFVTEKYGKASMPPLMSEAFGKFLSQRKDLSPTEKDFFYALVISQTDLNYANVRNYDKIARLIDKYVVDKKIKKELKTLQKVLMGVTRAGNVPNLKIENSVGVKTNIGDLNNKKPTLIMFYASYNPNLSLTTLPILKKINELYSSKLDFVFVNLDDKKDIYLKTIDTLLKGMTGSNYYVHGGINSDEAKRFGLYAFKLPNFILIDKNERLVGREYFSLEDPEFLENLEKLTGKKENVSELLKNDNIPQIQDKKE